MTAIHNTPNEQLFHLTEQEWAQFGLNDIAYIKPVQVQGKDGFGAFAADGSPMFVAESREVAEAALIQQGIEPVSAH